VVYVSWLVENQFGADLARERFGVGHQMTYRSHDLAYARTSHLPLTQGRTLFWQITQLTLIVEPWDSRINFKLGGSDQRGWLNT